MLRSATSRWMVGLIVFIAVLGVVRFKPWVRANRQADATHTAGGRELLQVGFLPVTCHLTCPVTDYATKTSKSTRFVSQRFTDFPTVVESIKAGRLQASFMIAPLAMKLREQGVPVNLCGRTVSLAPVLPSSRKNLVKAKSALPSPHSRNWAPGSLPGRFA